MPSPRRSRDPDARAARRTLASLLSRGVLSGGDVDEMIALWRRAHGVDALSIGQGFGFRDTARTSGVPDAWIRTHQRLVHLDGSAEALLHAPRSDVFHVATQHVPGELIHAFRAEWSDAVIGILRSPLGPPVFYALYRRTGLFSSDEVEDLRALQLALEDALATRTALGALEAPAGERVETALRRVVAHARVSLYDGALEWGPGSRTAVERAAGNELGPGALRRLERALVAVARRARSGARSQRFAFGLRAEVVGVPSAVGPAALVLLVRDEHGPVDAAAPVLELLSPRQRACALAMAAGTPLPALAAELGVTVETARTHVRAAYRALGVRTRLELARLLVPE